MLGLGGGLNSYETAFQKLLARRIDEQESDLAMKLVQGIARGSDVSATAQAYWESVGYARAMRDTRQWCEEIESDLQKA